MAARARQATQRGHGGRGLVVPASLAQVRALAHPLRLRLLELFTERTRTTKQAADAMGVPTTRLYHHVAALERAGFLRLERTRRVRGATEKYFAAVRAGAPGDAAAALRTESGRRGATALGALLLEQASRELVSALARCRPGDADQILALRAVLRLRPAELGRLRRELLRLLRTLPGKAKASPGRAGSGRRRWMLTLALVPVAEDEPAAE